MSNCPSCNHSPWNPFTLDARNWTWDPLYAKYLPLSHRPSCCLSPALFKLHRSHIVKFQACFSFSHRSRKPVDADHVSALFQTPHTGKSDFPPSGFLACFVSTWNLFSMYSCLTNSFWGPQHWHWRKRRFPPWIILNNLPPRLYRICSYLF